MQWWPYTQTASVSPCAVQSTRPSSSSACPQSQPTVPGYALGSHGGASDPKGGDGDAEGGGGDGDADGGGGGGRCGSPAGATGGWDGGGGDGEADGGGKGESQNKVGWPVAPQVVPVYLQIRYPGLGVARTSLLSTLLSHSFWLVSE